MPGEAAVLDANDGDPGLVTFAYYEPDGSSVSGIIAVDQEARSEPCEAHGHVTAS